MTKSILFAGMFVIITIVCSSFKPLNSSSVPIKNFSENCGPFRTIPAGTTHEGKAYWYSYYNNGNNKKLYITQVYNTDCNYCNNEITSSFKKWLILNDYENTVSTVNIDNLQDIDAESLQKRREATIIKYKGYGYSIVKVDFSYNED